MVARGIWVEIPDHAAHHVSPLFAIPKRTGGIRLIIDLRHINKHLDNFKTTYETLRDIQPSLLPDRWMGSIDLSDGFFHLYIDRADRRYLQVQVDNKFYTLQALPFGLSYSPYAFTKLMRPVLRRIRRTMGCAHLYVDDLLLVAPGCRETRHLIQQVEQLYTRLGLQINKAKSILEPTQSIRHLGLILESAQQRYRIPEDKLRRIERQATDILTLAQRYKRRVPSGRLASFAGLAQSLRLALPPAQLLLRSLYDDLGGHHGHEWVSVRRCTLVQLRWWRRLSRAPEVRAGASFRDLAPIVLHTDASLTGWGASCDGQRFAQGEWDATTRRLPIHLLEVRAVTRALAHFGLQNASVLLACDNTAAVHTIRGLRARSAPLVRELQDLWKIMFECNVQVRPVYLSTARNIWADRLSRTRVTIPGDLKVSFIEWVRTYVDPRATAALLTPFSVNNGVYANALRLGWNDHVIPILSPPWELLGEVVTMTDKPALLLFPDWAGGSWWNLVQEHTGTGVRLPKKCVYDHPFQGVTTHVWLRPLHGQLSLSYPSSSLSAPRATDS